MFLVQKTEPQAVHSAVCSKCKSICVSLIMEDGEKCLAEVELHGNKRRQVCFADTKASMRGYICNTCGHREEVTSFKELRSSAWYTLLGSTGVDFVGIVHTLVGHKIEAHPGFMDDTGGNIVNFDRNNVTVIYARG